jgi:small subunit ribosomal protein S21
MPSVKLFPNEPIEKALRRLKTKVDSEGILEELKRKRAFETPSQKVARKLRNHTKRAKLNIRSPFWCPFPPSRSIELDKA